MLNVAASVLLFFLLFASALRECWSDFVLNEEVVKLARSTIELEDILFNDKDFNEYPLGGVPELFLDQLDGAIAISRNGRCHVNFRGSTPTVLDWWQNLNPTTANICSRYNGTICCDARTGFVEGYYASYAQELEDWIDECISLTCPDSPTDCLIISGHSQGGGIAAVAAVVHEQYNPMVIQLAAPKAIHMPCRGVVDSNRWYQFVGTTTATGNTALLYDLPPFAPGLGADLIGHMILFSPESDQLAYLGLDIRTNYHPNFMGPEHGIASYLRRTDMLRQMQTTGEITVSGFHDGSLCTRDTECASGTCRGGWLRWFCDQLNFDACACRRCSP